MIHGATRLPHGTLMLKLTRTPSPPPVMSHTQQEPAMVRAEDGTFDVFGSAHLWPVTQLKRNFSASLPFSIRRMTIPAIFI